MHCSTPWDVHHFHFSDKMRTDGLVGRSSELLVAALTENDVYLIETLTHRQWEEVGWAPIDLLRIMETRWPDEGIIWHVKTAIGLVGGAGGEQSEITASVRLA